MAKLLCIEDDAELLEIITEELADAGHTVLQAADGCVGLEMILKHNPDLVISDISMPGMNGYVLLKTLRNNHPDFAEMPFIFLSALADRDHVIDGLDLGADDYLTKPIDYEMLAVRVDSRLRQSDRMRKKKEADISKLVQSFESIGEAAASVSGDLTWK
ncbi:MAG: response regulator [Hyphomicrobiales bacterium]|nr:response regulator [Hyphomicrobiales bacterium]